MRALGVLFSKDLVIFKGPLYHSSTELSYRCRNNWNLFLTPQPGSKALSQLRFFLLAPGLLSAEPTVGEGERPSILPQPSHLEEADDTGNPPTVTEAGFERMTPTTTKHIFRYIEKCDSEIPV